MNSASETQNSISGDSLRIAVFGALWGLLEITVGATLKGLRIPMSGAILTALSILIVLTGRYFVRRRFSILMMGGVAALLKIFSVGVVIAGPFMAILMEALLAEILISVFGVNRLSYVLTGMSLLLYTIIHPFVAQGIIFGDNIFRVYLEMFGQITRWLQWDASRLVWVIGGYAFIHVFTGAIVGWITYSLAVRAEKEIKYKAS